MSEALPVAKAAIALGCSPDTVRRLIAAGRLRAFRVGLGQKRQKLVVTADEIARFQREQQVGNDVQAAPPAKRNRRKQRRWI